MSQNSNAAVVVTRHLPTPTPEGRRKVAVGTIPARTSREAVDAAFTHAETVIDRFRYCGEAGCSPKEWEGLLSSLAGIENNPANSGGLRCKAGFLKREMKRQERRYATDFGGGNTRGSGSGKTKARKAAKAAASRALRAKMKSPKRG